MTETGWRQAIQASLADWPDFDSEADSDGFVDVDDAGLPSEKNRSFLLRTDSALLTRQCLMHTMLPCRNTIISALMCGLAVASMTHRSARAQDPTPDPWVSGADEGLSGSGRDDVNGYVWPRYRQILPNPFASGIQQTSFLMVEPRAMSADEDEQSAGQSSGQTSTDAQLDLAARVRELEQEVARLTSNDASQTDDAVTSRLDYLEKTVGEFQDEGAQFLETLSKNSLRVFNGRLQLDSWDYPVSSPGIDAMENGNFTDPPQNRLLVRRARIGVTGTVPPDNMSYRLDLEFSGEDGGRIRDAWLAWDDLPYVNTLRIGNQKRPYGLDQLNSSNFMTFLERPFIVEAVNNNNRRLGLACYGASSDLARNWQFGIFNMVPIQDTNQIVGNNVQQEFVGRFANTAWYDESSGGRGYAHLAVAGVLAFPDGTSSANQAVFKTRPEARTNSDWLDTGQIAGAKSYQLLALESVFNVGAFQLAGEWMNVRLQRDVGFGSDVQFNGGYLAFSYFLTGEHIPWNRTVGMVGRVKPFENFFCVNNCDGTRGRGLGAWQVALRLSRADLNDSNIRGGIGESLTLALNWYWNANTRLQVNYLFGQIDDRRTTLTNGMTPTVSGDYQIMGTRFMIDF